MVGYLPCVHVDFQWWILVENNECPMRLVCDVARLGKMMPQWPHAWINQCQDGCAVNISWPVIDKQYLFVPGMTGTSLIFDEQWYWNFVYTKEFDSQMIDIYQHLQSLHIVGKKNTNMPCLDSKADPSWVGWLGGWVGGWGNHSRNNQACLARCERV